MISVNCHFAPRVATNDLEMEKCFFLNITFFLLFFLTSFEEMAAEMNRYVSENKKKPYR
jgi:hypothetical protein